MSEEVTNGVLHRDGIDQKLFNVFLQEYLVEGNAVGNMENNRESSEKEDVQNVCDLCNNVSQRIGKTLWQEKADTKMFLCTLDATIRGTTPICI